MSAWSEAGFPFGFRFRNPRDVFYSICCAMAERSLNYSQTVNVDDEEYYEHVKARNNPPRPFQDKNTLISNYKDTVFKFMQSQIMQIASCYCDPDKAYDFENYPDLENWTAESLEDKLKEKYVKFTPFCDREKYLLFIYHVLNLCTVRRAAIIPEYGCEKYRDTGDKRYYYSELDEAKSDLINIDFSFYDWYNPANKVRAYRYDDGEYQLSQHKIRFLSWIDEKRPCDITFYGFASDYEIDEFYNFGADYIKRNKWFRVGEPNVTEEIKGKLRVSRELDIPDNKLPANIPELERRTGYSIGFSSGTNDYNIPYAYAVRDQRKYLQYANS